MTVEIPKPEEIGAPSEDECTALAAAASLGARKSLERAVLSLYFAKRRSGDRRPWLDLVEAYRQMVEPVRTEIQVVDDAGTPRVQVAYIDRGYGLKGDEARLFKAVSELATALNDIEQEAQRNKANGRKGGRPAKGRAAEIWAWLQARGYEQASNKKSLKLDAESHFQVRKTVVSDAVTWGRKQHCSGAL